MSEWKEVLLQDVVSILGDGLHGTPEYDDNGDFYFINGNNLSNGKIVIKPDTKKTAIKEYEKYKKNLNERTILLSINGTLGNIAYYNGEKCILGKSACYFNVLHDVDKEFIRYVVTDKQFQSYIDTLAHGSTIKNVSLKTIREYSFSLPPLSEQKAIAGVLSSLDDKIDLLQRQNKTLEGMAEALWRKMFIEDADESWEEYSLLDIIDLVGGGTPKTEISDYWNGDIPWLSGRDITVNHRNFILSTEKNITEIGLNNSSTKLLPKFSTVISARGTVGNYCILAESMAFSQSNYGILPKIQDCYFFTYLLIHHAVDELKSASYGSVFDTITTNTFRDQKINLPVNNVIIEFEKSISKYFIKILKNSQQIQSLSKMRNILLPQLMSGEIRVKL